MITNENLVLLQQNFNNDQEAITALAELALAQDLVDEAYLPALLQREEAFPTGLELPVPIAIPHIEVGCKKSFVSIATLAQPVPFKSMDQSGTELAVRIVFVFGILDPKSQLEILKKFARSFAQGEKITALVNAGSKRELLSALNVLLDDMMVIEDV